jgi:hypothetical protein
LAKSWQSFQKALGKILAWECIGVYNIEINNGLGNNKQ